MIRDWDLDYIKFKLNELNLDEETQDIIDTLAYNLEKNTDALEDTQCKFEDYKYTLSNIITDVFDEVDRTIDTIEEINDESYEEINKLDKFIHENLDDYE